MKIFILFLLCRYIASDEQKMRHLECFSSTKVKLQKFPKFILEVENTEIIHYNEKDALETGIPTCVVYYGYNETHSVMWQGHVSNFVLPLECTINEEIYTHCFKSPNPFIFLPFPSGWACCCSAHKCNRQTPRLFQFLEQDLPDSSKILNLIKPVCKYSFCIFFCLSLVAFETILEALIFRICGKNKRKRFEDGSLQHFTAAKQLTVSPGGGLIQTPMTTPTPGSSLQLQATQESYSLKPSEKVSEMLMEPVSKPSLLPLDRTQYDIDAEEAEPELQPSSTQVEYDDTKVPIPQKPECRVTKTGRLQKTSMNYEESTYSDLELT